MSKRNGYDCLVYYLRPGHTTESKMHLSDVDDVKCSEGGDLIIKSVNDDDSVRRFLMFARGQWLSVDVEDVGAPTGGADDGH